MGGAYTKPAEVKSVHFPKFADALPSMAGKTVAVTGCTTGTGYVCARVCAEKGAKVFLLNRPSERADAALRALKEAVPSGTFSSVPCDLMSFESVRGAAKCLREELAADGLDVLCNNAGIMAVKDGATTDGCCVQMQTNHLSHFLLTSEVWPLLEKAAELRSEARVVNHSSGARKFPAAPVEEQYLGKNGGKLGGDDLGMTPFSGPRWKRYQQTKLANVVFTYALRDRVEAKGGITAKVKSLVAHPGLSATSLQVTSAEDGGMGKRFTSCLMGNASQSMEDGAMGILRCCCDAESKSGDFFGPKGMTGLAVLEPDEKLANQVSRDMLWQKSTEVTGASFLF